MGSKVVWFRVQCILFMYYLFISQSCTFDNSMRGSETYWILNKLKHKLIKSAYSNQQTDRLKGILMTVVLNSSMITLH
jgi:hypothetical protein